MYAGKRCNGNPNSTKRLKLDGVAPVDNRPSTNKDGGPKQLWCCWKKKQEMLDMLFVKLFFKQFKDTNQLEKAGLTH